MVTIPKRQQWTLVAMAATAVAEPIARRAVASAWRLAAGDDPPEDTVSRDVEWGRALAWVAASALAVALARVVARRGAALAWERVTGERPPRPRARGRRGRKIRQRLHL